MADWKEAIGYGGRRVLVVGGATGMGAAVARLTMAEGASTVVLDSAPVDFDVTAAVQVDLGDRESADRALDAALEACLLYTSPSPRDATLSRMPSSA